MQKTLQCAFLARPKEFEHPAPGVGVLRHPNDRLGSYPDRHEGLFPDRREDEGDSGHIRLPSRRRGERRRQLITVLYERKNDTVGNLALELAVSSHTIRNDIRVLELEYPIYTKVRAGGGVFILDSSRLQQRWLTVRQRELLMSVCDMLDDKKLRKTNSEEKKAQQERKKVLDIQENHTINRTILIALYKV